MAVDTSKDVPAVVQVAPASSFYFSPPLMRTRSRTSFKPSKPDLDLKSRVNVMNILPDSPGDLVKVITTKKKTRSAKKVKSSSTSPSNESVIKLLSPVAKDESEEPDVEPQRRGPQKKPVTLRPKRVVTKKKGTLKLW